MDGKAHGGGLGEAAIETQALTKRFGARTAVDAVDLTVPRASAFGFLGPNGAGKTTLIRTLLGLTSPTSGSMRLLGRQIPQERALALRRVGAIVEEPKFHPHLTGRENLEIIAAARERETHDRIPSALARVGLAARAGDRVRSYSLGMRQRLGVARCLIADPQLLILDEPMNGLDPAGIQEFREMMAGLVHEGRTVFLSSHLLDEVEKTCDRVAIIDRGVILKQGSVAEVANVGRPTIRIRCDALETAEAALGGHPAVGTMDRADGSLVVALGTAPGAPTDEAVADLNRRLVAAGVAVYSIAAERVSLEERFLEMTSRLDETP
jgi:ABC-2 type transport system ATP-binding protein